MIGLYILQVWISTWWEVGTRLTRPWPPTLQPASNPWPRHRALDGIRIRDHIYILEQFELRPFHGFGLASSIWWNHKNDHHHWHMLPPIRVSPHHLRWANPNQRWQWNQDFLGFVDHWVMKKEVWKKNKVHNFYSHTNFLSWRSVVFVGFFLVSKLYQPTGYPTVKELLRVGRESVPVNAWTPKQDIPSPSLHLIQKRSFISACKWFLLVRMVFLLVCVGSPLKKCIPKKSRSKTLQNFAV